MPKKSCYNIIVDSYVNLINKKANLQSNAKGFYFFKENNENRRKQHLQHGLHSRN